MASKSQSDLKGKLTAGLPQIYFVPAVRTDKLAFSMLNSLITGEMRFVYLGAQRLVLIP